MSYETIAAVLSVVILDLTISGDNALVIGMAAHRLPPSQRRLAILIGMGGAILLRVLFTLVASFLFTVPLLQAFGGVILIWIAFKLLTEEEVEEQPDHQHGETLAEAIRIVIVADVVMSLDNVLAVAGASHGNPQLLLFGLALSMPIVMFGSALVASLIHRLRWLVYVGALVLAWTSAQMILEDPVIGPFIPDHALVEVALTIFIAVVVFAASVGWGALRGRGTRGTLS